MMDQRLASAALFADPTRLDAQANLTWAKELAVLRRLGLRDGMNILELGCGPGVVTEMLLDAFSASRVDAVDLDPTMCTLTKARLSKHIPDRLNIIQESVLNTSFDDESFDFAVARYLFQHLASPKLALTEIFRLLKPGATLAIIDSDDALSGIFDSGLGSLAVIAGRIRSLQAKRGGDRFVGRKLWRLLNASGFEGLSLDPIAIHSDEAGLDPFLPQYHPDRFVALVSVKGGLTQEEWETYRSDYERFAANPEAFIMHLLLIVSGRKPTV